MSKILQKLSKIPENSYKFRFSYYKVCHICYQEKTPIPKLRWENAA